MAKKPALAPTRWQPPRPGPSAPAAPRRMDVIRLPGDGPEDVALDDQGRVLTGLVDGRILRVSPDGRHIETIADTGGRPLGVEVDPDGDLWVCDARRGVLHVNVRTGAVTELVTTIGASAMLFCNNGALTGDGTMYFSDSSTKFGIDHYKGELLAHSGTGRLFRRNPDASVELVADGLQFANGVALAPAGSWLAIAQTGAYCLDRIWLSGPRAGEREVLVDNLPAFPDNIATGSDGLIWVALPSPRDPLLDALLPRPPALRKAVWALPEAFHPKEKKIVWVQGYDADGRLVHDLRTEHEQFYMATGVRERDGVVWVGSQTAPAMARIEL